MASKYPTLFILKVLDGGGVTMLRETVNENYFYHFIYMQEINEHYFY